MLSDYTSVINSTEGQQAPELNDNWQEYRSVLLLVFVRQM